MKPTETQKKLIHTMKETGISMETAMKILIALPEKEQQMQMIEYLIKWKDIMTDHQAKQEAARLMKN